MLLLFSIRVANWPSELFVRESLSTCDYIENGGWVLN